MTLGFSILFVDFSILFFRHAFCLSVNNQEAFMKTNVVLPLLN